MNKKEFIIYALNTLNIPITKNAKGISIVEAIALGYRSSGWSAQSYSNYTKKNFPNKKHGEHITTYLLNIFEVAFCKDCDSVKPKDSFALHTKHSTGVQNLCIACTGEYFRDKVDMVFYAAKRRADTLDRTPKWADIDKIKEFYKNRPEGYHVDHIIPLRGVNVSGLHIVENLQYLTAKENLRKGNRYDPLAQ